LETWEANTPVSLTPEGGAEFFVLEGGFEESGEQFEKGSWLRTPVDQPVNIKASASGAKVWIKTGHLTYAKRPVV
ncbi:MAG: cupin domain-containing protein, partial [Kordiimonas sp.]